MARKVASTGSRPAASGNSLELFRSDNMLARNALSLLGAVAVTFDPSTDTLSAPDRSALAALLRTPKERLPRAYSDFKSMLSGKATDLRNSALQALSPNHNRYIVTYPVTARDGVRLWLEERGTRTPENPALFHCVLRDVTNETQNKFRQAFDHEQTETNRSPAPDAVTVSDILTALKDETFTLAYQPIVTADTRTVHHYECLLRRKTTVGDFISAADYVIAAEKLGHVHLLDKRALEIGSDTLRRNPNLHLALNVSAGTVESELAAESYLSALKALGSDARRVTLELTETLALQDDNNAATFSQKVRALGCQFAIDDFGTGHTTFKNLMTVKPDMIKIDGSMVKNLSETPCKQAFIRLMVDMAETFDVETVAEMVTDHADAEMLQNMGVTYFQSYIFGKPDTKAPVA